jgi:putative acetyltransferase
LLRDVTRLYVRAQRNTVACCGPQSTARCHVLGELARSGSLRLTELAARLDADKSWTSRTVAAMAEEGLLSSSGTEADARVVQVELTPAGRRRWQGMDSALRRHAVGALSRLSAEDRQVVYRGLALLREVLEEGAGGSAGSPASTARRGHEGRPAARRPRREPGSSRTRT